MTPAARSAATSGSKTIDAPGGGLPPSLMRLLLRLYPPYLGTGIRVRRISPDYRRITVDMKLRFYNRNVMGTHFGGSLSAMTDPFYALMLMNNLGRDYVVWDRAGTIEYRKPGRGRVVATFEIDQACIDQARRATASGARYEPTLAVDVVDESGDIVAHVTRTLYIRRRRGATVAGHGRARTGDASGEAAMESLGGAK